MGCNMPEIRPLKEVTQVNGNAVRPYVADRSWQSVSGKPITFHSHRGWDVELIVLFVLLSFLSWSFGLVVKCKSRILQHNAQEKVFREISCGQLGPDGIKTMNL